MLLTICSFLMKKNELNLNKYHVTQSVASATIHTIFKIFMKCINCAESFAPYHVSVKLLKFKSFCRIIAEIFAGLVIRIIMAWFFLTTKFNSFLWYTLHLLVKSDSRPKDRCSVFLTIYSPFPIREWYIQFLREAYLLRNL